MSTLQEDARFRLLRALHNNPHITQRELAAKLGVSLGVTNFILRALLEKGVIKTRNFRGNNNKLSYIYFVTPQGLREKAALTARFLERKQKEYVALSAELEAVRNEFERNDRLMGLALGGTDAP